MAIEERFLRYVNFDTMSKEDATCFPSTKSQLEFGKMLCEELLSMGVKDAFQDEKGYVYGHIPGEQNKETIGLIAHMDTSPSLKGGNYNPRIIRDYDGTIIHLNDQYELSPIKFPSLQKQIHHDLIVTDGEHLLGGDDKAGITIIMETISYFLNHPEIKHSPIAICFTPDEEIGEGASYFDVKKMNASIAYTIDGGAFNEVNIENFNASSCVVTFKGIGVHPGYAKDVMINAIKLGVEFEDLLPVAEVPEHTEGYEGFYHLCSFEGDPEFTKLTYILRDHDADKLEYKMKTMNTLAFLLRKKYPTCEINVEHKPSYKNMKLYFEKDPHAVDVIKEAFKASSFEPVFTPIRGGTDGATITYMGLPCPNLGTGDYNCHGRYEYVSINEMKNMITILKNLLTL